MTALIDADYLKSLPLGVKGPNAWPEADHLTTLIETASTMVEDFCERKFALQAHTDIHRGRDSYRLILDEWPVVSLTSVSWEDDATGQTGTVDTTLLRVSEAGVVEFKRKDGRVGDSWNMFYADRLYTVVYQAGFATIPGPVKHAVALQAAELLRPNYAGPRADVPELVPLTSQMIVDLLDPKYRRKLKRG